MTVDPRGIKVLVFDVGGTVFDWHGGISAAASELADRKGVIVDASAFAIAWRGGFFKVLARVRSGKQPRLTTDVIHRRVLDRIARDFPSLSLTPADKRDLTQAWHRLPAWPDAAPAIARLRERYEVVVLSVLSFSLVLEASKANGITWDGIISCEFLEHYKPDVQAYLEGAKLLQVEPAQCMMVATHAWDLDAAREAGLKTAFVPREFELGKEMRRELWSLPNVDLNVTDFDDLANRLLS